MRIPFEQLVTEFKRVLLQVGFPEDKAHFCALAFAENSRDGVYTHGLNRFPKFVRSVKAGEINRDAMPTLVNGLGALERWMAITGPAL